MTKVVAGDVFVQQNGLTTQPTHRICCQEKNWLGDVRRSAETTQGIRSNRYIHAFLSEKK